MSELRASDHPAIGDPPSSDVDWESVLSEACTTDDPIHAAELRERAVLAHRGLARSLARQFAHRGVDLADLEQIAMLGLVYAARRFRPDRGRGFAAFATPTITGEIKRYFRDHGWSVRPPRGLQEAHQQIRQVEADLTQRDGSAPNPRTVADATGLSLEVVQKVRLLREQYRASSLDAPARSDATTPLGELLEDDEDRYERVDDTISLRPALAALSPREQRILRLRFEDNLTQRQIGVQIGVSQMQVSRLLRSALERLRSDMIDPNSGGGPNRVARSS